MRHNSYIEMAFNSYIRMVLTGKSTVTGSEKGATLYISIPSGIAKDSQCPLKRGDKISISVVANRIILEKRGG